MISVKPWIIAARLRTLPLAFSSILVGISLAANKVQLDYSIAGFTLLTAILLQILSNFANDYGDAVSGVDSTQRKGPDRMVQSGAITKRAMRNALIFLSILTLISGLSLLSIVFPENWKLLLIFLAIGLAAIGAAIKYTVGKNPYGYAGFGDVFVFIFFGIVAVAGTFFLQTRSIDWLVFLPASSLGFFAVGVLNVNNIRDIDSDKKAGKYSIPVRLGKKKAEKYHAQILSLGLLLSTSFVLLDFDKPIELGFLLTIPLFIKNIRAVIVRSGSDLNPYLKQMVLSTLLFSLLFTIGQFFS